MTSSAGTTRRERALPFNVTLWALICGALVLVAGWLTADLGRTMGPYRSGAICLVSFIAIAWYSVRKRLLWLSLRILRATTLILPAPLQRIVVALDRLETWRAMHVTLGILVLLPLWWHMSTGLMSPVEALLAFSIVLLMLSGIFGIVVQDYLPHAVRSQAEHEVRERDVETRKTAVFVEAEEKILHGHSPELIDAYSRYIKTAILNADEAVPWYRFLWATMRGASIGPEFCASLYERIAEVKKLVVAQAAEKDDYRKILAAWDSVEVPAWKEAVGFAITKIDLDQNAFNLRLSTRWLSFHIVVALLTFALLIFHVLAAIYFYGV